MTLQDYWDKQEAHGGDITFADGKTLDLKEQWCRKSYSILTKSTLAKAIEEYGNEGTAIQVLGSSKNPKNGYIAYRGEGSMGNEGFVAYADNHGKLIWLLFLDFSNPFWNIEIEGDNILATTELKCVFTIPIDSPEKLSCGKCNQWEREHSNKREQDYLNTDKSIKQ